MGRGNVCVHNPYEGLYFIDNDHFYVYRREDCDGEFETRLMGDLDYQELTSGEWYFDEYGTMEEQGDVEECIADDFARRFRSFTKPSKERWLDRSMRVLLESNLFYLVAEDNEWSIAIKLIQKQDPYDDHLLGLQKRHYLSYLEGLKESMLNRLPSIGTYKGAWTSGVITREELKQ